MKKIIFFVSVAICIGLIYLFPHLMLSPGELAAGHQPIKNDCFQCHKAFGGIAADKCISCHTLADIGKANSSLSTPAADGKNTLQFHLTLATTQCTSCHSEHAGIKPEKSFKRFTHELLSASARNACDNCHTKPVNDFHNRISAECGSCHKTTGWKSGAVFNHLVIASAEGENCMSCHQKPADGFHQGVSNTCGTCHGTAQWKPATFNHSSYFELDRNHNVKCSTCHTMANNFKAYSCYGCHEHTVSNMERKHSEEGITNLNNCARCHKDGSERGEHGGREDD